MTFLEKLEKLHPDVIDEFIRTGQSSVINTDMQNIIRQMVFAMEIYSTERNIMRAARKLQIRTKAQLSVDIDISTAKSRIYASLNYFDVDCNVAENVWLRDAANKFEDLAKYAISKGRVDVAERCYDKAVGYRLRAVAADKEASLGVIYIISDDIKPEDLGFTTKSMKEIARKSNQGYYTQLIDSLNVSEKEKVRLRTDAGISDIEFEEIEEEYNAG